MSKNLNIAIKSMLPATCSACSRVWYITEIGLHFTVIIFIKRIILRLWYILDSNCRQKCEKSTRWFQLIPQSSPLRVHIEWSVTVLKVCPKSSICKVHPYIYHISQNSWTVVLDYHVIKSRDSDMWDCLLQRIILAWFLVW